MLSLFIDAKYVFIIAVVCAPLLCAALLKAFSKFLPKDHGRAFAVDGEKSAGKIRGAGIILTCSFIISALLFASCKPEYAIYYVLIFLSMLSGYLDDRSEEPWGGLKKGIIDLFISAAVAFTFVYFNKELLLVSFFGHAVNVHPVVYVILGTVLVWTLINAVNCTDGIDGFCATLSSVSFISFAAVIALNKTDSSMLYLTLVMLLTLMPYLWKNAQPSSMLMGDAGSRALGVFMAIAAMKSGNALLAIPLCFVIFVDGLIGITKIVLIKVFHSKILNKIRTPLHDHSRKNKGWSDTQVIYRYCIIQALISLFTVGTML